jgi:hypothetical protein
VSPENINTLIRENVKEDPVIISIDIDSYDYFVLEALEYTPEILIMEYNSSFGLEPVTVPLDSLNDKTPKGFHGASLVAITKLAKKKGYRLVVCDESGTNAYFLRDDVLPNIPGVLPEIAFRPQKTRKDPFNEEPRTINLAKLVEVSGQELQQV